MTYQFFSHNGGILPVEQAVVPISRVEYSYGFGVYESIRVAKQKIFFLDEHCQRLMDSASVIGLEHVYSIDAVKQFVSDLIAKNEVDACNVKILLIGGPTADLATLDILCLNPLFPDRKLYQDGASCITYEYEREYPAAKTLNMLSSYLAYRQAKLAGAYDALFVNRRGQVVEGTRTNFFGLKGRTLISPPADQILPGVTRKHIIKVAKKSGFDFEESEITLNTLSEFDSVFLTSTSSKIMPVKNIDDHQFTISDELRELMAAFNRYLDEQA